MADADELFATENVDDFEPELDIEGEEAPVESGETHDVLYKFHPDTIMDYAETIIPKVPLQSAPPGGTSDVNHQSPPFLTVYERAKILGTRCNQLANGARPFVTVPEYMTQPLEIAKLELEQRRLPFIVKRPMPDGTFEYWRLSDLMIL